MPGAGLPWYMVRMLSCERLEHYAAVEALDLGSQPDAVLEIMRRDDEIERVRRMAYDEGWDDGHEDGYCEGYGDGVRDEKGARRQMARGGGRPMTAGDIGINAEARR